MPFSIPSRHLCLLFASIFFILVQESSAVDILTTSVLEIELGNFTVNIYALKPGTTQRLEKFSIKVVLAELIEFIDFKFFEPDRRLAFNSTPFTSSNTRLVESGVAINRFEQTAFFSNGVNFTMRIETFNATVVRNYFGWKLSLSPKNVKATFLINGTDMVTLPGVPRYPGSSYQIGIYANYAVEMMLDSVVDPAEIFRLGLLNCADLANSGLPVFSCPGIRFQERFSPSIPTEDAQFTRLDIRDARLNISITHQEDTLMTNATGSYFEQLETFRFVVPGVSDELASIFSILQQAARIATGPGRYGVLNITTAIAFRPDLSGAKHYDYDPDLSLIFNAVSEGLSPSGAPTAATASGVAAATGAIIGGVIAAVIVVLIVISVPVLLKVVFPYMASKKGTQDTTLTEIEDSADIPQQRPNTWTRASRPE